MTICNNSGRGLVLSIRALGTRLESSSEPAEPSMTEVYPYDNVSTNLVHNRLSGLEKSSEPPHLLGQGGSFPCPKGPG